MPEPVRCDCCSTIGLRGLAYPCPHDWYFIRSEDEGGQGAYYVFACSKECKEKLWQRGPGPKLGEEPVRPAQTAKLAGSIDAIGAMFCEHANEAPTYCRCPRWCYCRGRTCPAVIER